MVIRVCFIVLYLFQAWMAYPQKYLDTKKEFDFINYEQNKLEFHGDSSKFQSFYSDLKNLIVNGEGNINILHIGSSHIQADVFSGQVRKHLQTMVPGLKSSRGFIFPYRIAKTNNPFNYGISYSGRWESCKSTNGKGCLLGLSGYSVTTREDSRIKLFASREYYLGYDFNKIKIFHNIDSSSFAIRLNLPDTIYSIQTNPDLGYTEFQLAEHIDTLELLISKELPGQTKFELYGISLETEDPGITYHSIGVNGSDLEAYLECRLLAQHTKALAPDLVILSIGINDAHTRYFNNDRFINEYQQLIDRIKSGSPQANIILTTNNDSYYRRRYPNKNGEAVRNAMILLAKRNHAAVWDLYSIMGGFNSIKSWEAYGLAKPDKIHFRRAGYLLLGDLFYEALVKPLDQSLHRP